MSSIHFASCEHNNLLDYKFFFVEFKRYKSSSSFLFEQEILVAP